MPGKHLFLKKHLEFILCLFSPTPEALASPTLISPSGSQEWLVFLSLFCQFLSDVTVVQMGAKIPSLIECQASGHQSWFVVWNWSPLRCGTCLPSIKEAKNLTFPLALTARRERTWHGSPLVRWRQRNSKRQKRETGEAAFLRVHYDRGCQNHRGFQGGCWEPGAPCLRARGRQWERGVCAPAMSLPCPWL